MEEALSLIHIFKMGKDPIHKGCYDFDIFIQGGTAVFCDEDICDPAVLAVCQTLDAALHF